MLINVLQRCGDAARRITEGRTIMGVSVVDDRRLILLRQAVGSYYCKNRKYTAWQNAELRDVTVDGACNFLIAFSELTGLQMTPPPLKK